jgi:glycosidase
MVRFVCTASAGANVFLAGEMNGWNAEGQRLSDADGDGQFEVVVPLATGQRFAYKFVVDGNWQEDAGAAEFVDDGFGGKNSIVEVKAGEGIQDAGAAGSATAPVETGAVTPAAPVGEAAQGLRSVKFSYQPVISGVSEVVVAGSFNDWNVGATPMSDGDGDGTYEVTLLLAPGTYQYKYVVDGTWLTDEEAEDFSDDGFGGRNSILHVDSRFNAIEVEVGDGEFYLEDLGVRVDYATVNEVAPGEVIFRTRAYLDDIQKVTLLVKPAGGDILRVPMKLALKDNVFATYEATVNVSGAEGCRFTFAYHDGGETRYAVAKGGFENNEPKPTEWALYDHDVLAPFNIPEWAQNAVYYQIFPDRFRNGEPWDPDFSEPYYDTRKTLPPSGKTNGEYFHFVEDWNDISGLQRSPYRTDGKPDYYSFYGGDIVGVMEKLDHLASLGVTVIYFNPVTDARSNHRYDPCDYLKLDPHLATEDQFRIFTARALEKGIRVIVDMAYNHTGDCHFAFQDIVENGRKSEYWDWYEFKKEMPTWPLPAGQEASDYYDCWWGFGLHPNLNFDLSRPNSQEMSAKSIEDARPNMEVVNYLLDSVDYWMGDLGVSGFRLDVPNEVPFWFWGMFRERCRQVRPEHVLIGEIWGDAGTWINPDVFDAVMNYKYFKDPVVKWIGQKQGNAATFDRELAPGRTRYPLQAVRAQMNLLDSHDTARFLNIAGDVRRLQLAATFSMTYVGAPHIYYGGEVALDGGRDPDCRRTFPWDQIEVPARAQTLEHFQKVGQLRRDHDALRLGSFRTVLAKGDTYSYLREYGDERLLVVLNNGGAPASIVVPIGNAGVADGTSVAIAFGPGEAPEVFRGAMKVDLPAVSGVVYSLGSANSGR